MIDPEGHRKLVEGFAKLWVGHPDHDAVGPAS